MFLDPTKLLDLVTLSDTDITKTVNFDLETAQNGEGTFVASVTGVTQANPGLPDYFIDCVYSGMTFPKDDPDKTTIMQMHAEALSAVQAFTPSQLTTALGFVDPAAVVGIINIDSTFAYDGQTNIFRVMFRLVCTDMPSAPVVTGSTSSQP